MHVAVGGPWQRAGLRLMRQVEIRSSARILDAGCGAGGLTLALARCAPDGEAMGLDIDAECIASARKLAAEQGIGNAVWQVADLMTAAPQPDFDLVYCNSTLHLLRPGLTATINLAGWVKAGGKLAIQMPAPSPSDEVRSAISIALDAVGLGMPFPTWSSPWYLPGNKEIGATLREAGLTGLRMIEEVEPLTFRSGDDTAAYFRGLLLEPYLEAIPEPKHARFLEAFGESFPLDNGMQSCLLKRLYLIGTKA